MMMEDPDEALSGASPLCSGRRAREAPGRGAPATKKRGDQDSAAKSCEQQLFLKNENESLHKLIQELNEQALGILYSSVQQNTNSDSTSSPNEYLVI